MKLALYRSILFWSGILVMGFLCWAWWQSLYRISHARFSHCAFSNMAGGVVVNYSESSIGPAFRFTSGPSARGWKPLSFLAPAFEHGGGRNMGEDLRERFETTPSQEAYFLATRELMAGHTPLERALGTFRYHSPSDWRLFLPYWVISLAFTCPWALTLLWRARRRKVVERTC